MSLDLSENASTTSDIAAARQADHIAFLHRAPFTLDGYKPGFLLGFREDCGYQQTQYQNLNIPVSMLDNDFRNPNLDRFVDRFFEHEPQVGVIGDVDEIDDVDAHVAAAREIQASYPEADLIVVPKSRAVIDAISEDLVLGYSRGYADRLAHEFSDSADPPADIVGVDWNGLHRGAQFGEFWTADGWDDSGRDADYVTVRKTVRHSLARVREFWRAHGIWPETTPQDEGLNIEYEGPTPADLSVDSWHLRQQVDRHSVGRIEVHPQTV